MRNSFHNLIVYGTTLLPLFLWIILVINVRGIYLNSRNDDALAMLHSLFPFYWFLLLIVLSLSVVVLSIDRKWLHILLLLQMSIIFYYTPIALSGFPSNPDTLWHTSIGTSISEVLSGRELQFSHYGMAYPLSFILTKIVAEVSGADILTYTVYIYPVFGVCATTLLGYVLTSKFLAPRNAFVSMLLTLPALHYFNANVSPRFDGFLLTLTVMIFLARFERKSTALGLLLMFPLILTHPTSPLIVGAFLLAIYFYKYISHDAWPPFSLRLILVLGIGWVSWLVYHAVLVQESVRQALVRIITLKFSSGLGAAAEFAKLGGGFIYQEISALGNIVYIGYLAIALAIFFLKSAQINLRRKRERWLADTMRSLTHRGAVPIISALFYIILSFGILLGATQKYEELQRALPFFILMTSIFIGAHIFSSRNAKSLSHNRNHLIVWLLFVFLSFPVISYSKEAYNTFPPSERTGMNFVAFNIPLHEKTISMYAKQQLIAFVPSFIHFRAIDFPPNLNETEPDIIILRKTGFFRISMRFDMSFETNQYTLLQNAINEHVLYDKIYSSSTFEIYTRQ